MKWLILFTVWPAAAIGQDVPVPRSTGMCESGHCRQQKILNMRKHSLRRHLANVEMVGREVQMVEGYGGYGGESRVFEMPGVKACCAG